MIAAIKRQAADALTSFRLIGSFICAELILFGVWSAASWLFLLLVTTEPLDGMCARRWSPKKRWHGMQGKTFNEVASGMLSVLVPGAMLVRFALADRFVWAESGRTHYWGVTCGLFMLATAACIWFRSGRNPQTRLRADIVQGWLFGLWVSVTMIVMLNQPRMHVSLGRYGLTIVVFCALVLLSWERLDDRSELRRPPR